MRIRLVLACLILPVLIACSRTGTEPRGCDLCVTGAIVYGHVLATTGAPVAGARVTVDLLASTCAASTLLSIGSSALTDAQGSYRTFALSPSAPATACLVVTATPPAGAGVAVSADTGHTVRLQDTYPSTTPLDSVRVDLVARTSGTALSP